MCLMVFHWSPQSQEVQAQRLVVAANRDEFFHRPAESLQEWTEKPGLLAGRDLGAEPRHAALQGLYGTWMGVTRSGRFAAVTNVRRPSEKRPQTLSRGELVTAFLAQDLPCAEYLLEVQARANRYNGFNLLVGDLLPQLPRAEPQLWWYSNRSHHAPLKLGPGTYGLSNALLDTPWPKVTRTVARFSTALAAQSGADTFFDLLADHHQAPDHELPQTGVSLEWERTLSAPFVHSENYGTRSSQWLEVRSDGSLDYQEKRFGPGLTNLGVTRLQHKRGLVNK
jgi:uncharacterized protein with NRDE domain